MDDDRIPLIVAPSRFEAGAKKKPQTRFTFEWSLLDELFQSGTQMIPLAGEEIMYGAYWDKSGMIEKASWDKGLLLVDHWPDRLALQIEYPEPFRVYLRPSGYALVWREGYRRRGFGEWRAVLRPVNFYEAALAMNRLPGILEALTNLAPRIAAYCSHPYMGRRAGKLAYWLRTISDEARKEGFIS